MKRPSKRKTILILGSVVLLTILICLIIGLITQSTPSGQATLTARAATKTAQPTDTTRPTKTPRPTATPRPTKTPRPSPTPSLSPTPAPTALPFAQIRQNVAGMTEAQWKTYLPTLDGQLVENWTGWLDNVDQSGSRYTALVDMDPPDDFLSTYDISFQVSQDLALQLKLDQPITFSGRIERVSEFLGSLTLHLADVTIHP